MEKGDESLKLEGQASAPWFEYFKIFLTDSILPEYYIEIMVDLMEPSFMKLGTYEEMRDSANLYPVADPNLTYVPIMEIMRTRLPLALTLAGLLSLTLASFFGLPFPYNIIALIALLGPAPVTAYGLKSQLN